MLSTMVLVMSATLSSCRDLLLPHCSKLTKLMNKASIAHSLNSLTLSTLTTNHHTVSAAAVNSVCEQPAADDHTPLLPHSP